ncbi:MAG TPA: outer membrane beta-barrel protein [Labilithrix sp.]|jgi:hypothetical protein|nr:outer membrane beta-barrel protein [Labilithrix sp.]
MKANLGIASVLAAAAVLVSTTEAAAAGNANGFGEKGELIVSADRLVPLFSYTYSSTTRTVGGVELTDSHSGSGLSLLWGQSLARSNTFQPSVHTIPRVAFDVTVIPRLTIGAAIAFGFGLGGTNETQTVAPNGTRVTRTADAPTATAIGLAPRVGYILPLTDIFAFWPRLGFGFYSMSMSTETTNNNNVVTTTKLTDTHFSLDVDPQFALVPLEHFFITFGPVVNIPLTGSRTSTTITGSTTQETEFDASTFHVGLTAGLGGWFNIF